MDYNIYIKNVHLLKSLFEKIEKTLSESDNILLKQKILELDKYLNESDNQNVYKELLVEKFHVTLIKMLRFFIDRNEFIILNPLCKIISLATEYSEEFSEALVVENISELLISATIKYGQKHFTPDCHDLPSFNNIIYYILHITYHIIRHSRFQQRFLQHNKVNQFKQTIVPWMSSKITNTRILAIFVLTWLRKDDKEDTYTLEEHSDIIKIICDYIKEGIKTQEKYYHGYSMWELLLGLQALITIDSIKKQMISIDGFVASLIKIINSQSSESKEIELSLGILWSLTFIEKNREILEEQYNIIDVVQHLGKHKDDAIRKKVKGLLWEINNMKKRDTENKSLEYDVFMSYCHAQRDVVSKLVKVLKTEFKVWVDTDNMKGSGLSDMATGIEQSKIFVMAVSSSYKASQCCRSEANWAFKLNKPIVPLIMVHKYNPDGWLGMMISSETYIDLSEGSDFSESCDKLMQHIRFKSNQVSQTKSVDEKAPDEKKKKRRDSVDNVETSLPSNVKEWTSQNVIHWLHINKLSNVKSKFVDFDGGMLLAMKNMMEKTYEKYNDNLEKKFQMSLTEILKFDSALSSLKI